MAALLGLALRPPWALLREEPYLAAAELLALALGLGTLQHARALSGRALFLWLAAHSSALLAEWWDARSPDAQDVWHARGLLTLARYRVPLGAVVLRASLLYISALTAARLRMRALSSALACSLLTALLRAPYHLVGAKLLWWTADPGSRALAERHFDAPWLFHAEAAAFAGSFFFLSSFAHGEMLPRLVPMNLFPSRRRVLAVWAVTALLTLPLARALLVAVYAAPVALLGLSGETACGLSALCVLGALAALERAKLLPTSAALSRAGSRTASPLLSPAASPPRALSPIPPSPAVFVAESPPPPPPLAALDDAATTPSSAGTSPRQRRRQRSEGDLPLEAQHDGDDLTSSPSLDAAAAAPPPLLPHAALPFGAPPPQLIVTPPDPSLLPAPPSFPAVAGGPFASAFRARPHSAGHVRRPLPPPAGAASSSGSSPRVYTPIAQSPLLRVGSGSLHRRAVSSPRGLAMASAALLRSPSPSLSAHSSGGEAELTLHIDTPHGERELLGLTPHRLASDALFWLAIGYLATLGALAALARPEAVVATGMHQPVGDCALEVAPTAPRVLLLGDAARRPFLCASVPVQGFSLACRGFELPVDGQRWYPVCGLPHESALDFVVVVTLLLLVAAAVFTQVLRGAATAGAAGVAAKEGKAD